MHAPPCFWSRTPGFLKARRSWEPSSSITTGKFSPFRTLRKASAVNICWTEHDSYLFFSQKSSSWHFLALAKLRSTAQVWNHQRIPKLVNRLIVACLWQIPCALLQGNSVGLPCYECFVAGFLTYPCHTALISCLMTAFFALCSKAIVQTFLATMLRSGSFNLRKVVLLWYRFCWIGAYSSPFKVLLLLRKVVRFRNFLRTLLPRRPSLVGADTSTEMGHFKTQILVNQKKGILGLGHTEPCLRWSHLLAFLGLFLFFSFLFLTFSRPLFVAISQPWRTQRLPWLSCTSTALVCSSLAKKSFAFLNWATRRTKNLNGESCTPLGGSLLVLDFSSFLLETTCRKKILRRLIS